MTDELKPCPFCGGDAELQSSTGDPWGEGRVSWRVLCKNHLGCQGGACNVWEITPEDASSKWNTRYERTCHKVPGKMHYGERRPKCSECGYGLGDSRWAFCPSCGAEVVDDD